MSLDSEKPFWRCLLDGMSFRHLITLIEKASNQGVLEVSSDAIRYTKSNSTLTVVNDFIIEASRCYEWSFTFPTPIMFGVNLPEVCKLLKRIRMDDNLELMIEGRDTEIIYMTKVPPSSRPDDTVIRMMSRSISVQYVSLKLPSFVGPPNPPNYIMSCKNVSDTFGAIKSTKSKFVTVKGFPRGIAFIQDNLHIAFGESSEKEIVDISPCVCIEKQRIPSVIMEIDHDTISSFKGFKNITGNSNGVSVYFGKNESHAVLRFDMPIGTHGTLSTYVRSDIIVESSSDHIGVEGRESAGISAQVLEEAKNALEMSDDIDD